jgi:DNA-binding HxlR family transcriptional regulator
MNKKNPYYKQPYYSIFCAINHNKTNSTSIARWLNRTKQSVINRQLKELLKDKLIKKINKKNKNNVINYIITDKGKKIRDFRHKYEYYCGINQAYKNFREYYWKWIKKQSA